MKQQLKYVTLLLAVFLAYYGYTKYQAYKAAKFTANQVAVKVKQGKQAEKIKEIEKQLPKLKESYEKAKRDFLRKYPYLNK